MSIYVEHRERIRKIMRKLLICITLIVTFAGLSPRAAFAQELQPGKFKFRVSSPSVSIEKPEDIGVKAHYNLRMLIPVQGQLPKIGHNDELPPVPGLFFETPASLACIYHLVKNPKPGCNPNETTEDPTGGSNTIALVEAFDDPTAAADLATFSAQFGLPPANLTVVFSSGTRPSEDPTGGGEIETSLDIEMAHAMAPNANLVLVEAPSLSLEDLFGAIIVAGEIVSSSGGGEVSMSFGFGEFPQETELDQFFTFPGVVYVASSGDQPGTIYPATSPNVLAAGGTSISRDPFSGRFLLEDTWQDAGGGPSLFEPRPDFQDVVKHIVGPARGTPDLSFDANPNSGVWIFDSNPVFGTGFFIVGGTSVSAPALAGIINSAGTFNASSEAENREIYRHIGDFEDFRDIVFGNCGFNVGNFALPGYDLCTGVGSDRGLKGK
jgi:kumamolisin